MSDPALEDKPLQKDKRGLLWSMTTQLLLTLIVLLGTSEGLLNAEDAPSAATQPTPALSTSAADDGPGWLFPVAKLDESLPPWLRFGGDSSKRRLAHS